MPAPLKHRKEQAPGSPALTTGIATCGARRDDGAVFSNYFRLVTCPLCRRIQKLRQAAARLRSAPVLSPRSEEPSNA